MRWLLLIPLLTIGLSVGCDDTVFPTNNRDYTPDWVGVQVFFFDHCIRCHPAIEPAIDLPGDIRGDVCGEFGSWVVPGDPDESMLWRVVSGEIRSDDPPIMPFGTGQLRSDQVDFLREWIQNGAVIEGCP